MSEGDIKRVAFVETEEGLDHGRPVEGIDTFCGTSNAHAAIDLANRLATEGER